MPTLAIASLFTLLIILCVFFVRQDMNWGATRDERTFRMTGDSYLYGGPSVRTIMTRAIFIDAPAEVVWPWLAQLGRGAGFYSIDWLDNGHKASARHIVPWIPPPALGDSTAIGYLRHVEIGKELIWWAGGARFLSARARMVVNVLLIPQVQGSRLVIRISADAKGLTSRIAIWGFEFIDTIMARRQLEGIKYRAERYHARTRDPARHDTGFRDQYQHYEVIYASGENAGVAGEENAAHWRRAARKDKII